MRKFAAQRLIVVCGDRPTIHLPAIEHGVRVLVITGGFTLSSGLVELAKLRGVSVITSPFDTLNTVLRIRSAQFIDSVVDRDGVTIDGKAALADARSVVERSSQPVFPVLGDDKYGDFALNKELARVGLKRMFLHAHYLELKSEGDFPKLLLNAPMPDELRNFLQRLN